MFHYVMGEFHIPSLWFLGVAVYVKMHSFLKTTLYFAVCVHHILLDHASVDDSHYIIEIL